MIGGLYLVQLRIPGILRFNVRESTIHIFTSEAMHGPCRHGRSEMGVGGWDLVEWVLGGGGK